MELRIIFLGCFYSIILDNTMKLLILQKHFTYDVSLEPVIKGIWSCRAAIRYSSTFLEWRAVGVLPPNVPQEVWDSWQASWNTHEFKKKCLAASKCRLSEVAGPDTGISRHTRGSKSTIDHYLDLVNNY